MPIFSKKSRLRLDGCHPLLIEVLTEVIKYFDFSVLGGRRNAAQQDRLYAIGKSKLRFPKSRHNANPSEAVDIAPYPIDWTDRERFTYLAGYIMVTARTHGILLRWGGNWALDNDLKNNYFDDLPHYELVKTERLSR